MSEPSATSNDHRTRPSARPWWKDALVYQVYVRSFADSNGDGVGDLAGIRSRLDHIASLGVEAIWLNPCYPSPQHDHGYDVANYFDIHDEYGTLDDFDALLADARDLGIKILMDLVPSHCSIEHRWFIAALASDPNSPERARFYFRDGKGDAGNEPPNNWQSAFGGPAWTRLDTDPTANNGKGGQWYLHTFAREQPDLDHTHADVHRLFDEIFKFWFDRGVEGFRVDAVAGTGKHPDLPDQPPVGPEVGVLDITWMNEYTVFRPEGHDVWRRFRTTIDNYESSHPDRELMMVAEAYAVRRPELVKTFTEPDQFHQMFSFDLMLAPWEKHSIEQAMLDPIAILADTGVPPAWTLNNHDIQRIVTRLGRADAHLPEMWTNNNLALSRAEVDLALGERRARAMTALIFALPGSLYLYQGEELGLPEVFDIPADRREDPVFERTGGAEIGRDGCRVPMPWTNDASSSYGFSTPRADGTVGEPWLPQPAGWGERSVSEIDDIENSTLHMYRSLGEVRDEFAVSQPLQAQTIDIGPEVVAVRRGDLVVVVNPTDQPVQLDLDHPELAITQPVFASEPAEMHTTGVIPANSTIWFSS
ncbi:MAG: alpha-glucosidase [Candidatus Azotimanducaceae bacterium]|jgi:alpha-glucosidase